MRIAQLTDCHLFADAKKTAYQDINPYQSLCDILNAVAQQQPDLLLFTGDISGDHSRQSYVHLKQLLADFSEVEIRMIPGNHDSPELMQAVFGNNVIRFDGQENWCRDSWQIHYLNTHFEGAKGRLPPQRLDTLEQAIRSAPNTSHLITVHHHPLNTGTWMDKHDWINRDAFLKTMAALPGGVRIIYGHIHHAFTRVLEAQSYYACPSTCWQWAQTAEFGVADIEAGYRLIDIDDNGGWQTEIKRIKAR